MGRLIVRLRWGAGSAYAEPTSSGRFALLAGSPFETLTPTGEVAELGPEALLAPVAPTKILGIGANYPDPEEVIDRVFPSFFLMPPSAILPSGADVVLPRFFGSVLAEGELAVVIGRRTRHASLAEAREAILGYTIANDLSGRDSTLTSVPAALKKGCDGFLPLGPHLLLEPEPRTFPIVTRVNGDVKQSGDTGDMVFSIESCIQHISQAMTLEPGDVISMGTPPPKPKVVPGDTMAVTIAGIGTLTNRVVSG